MSTPERDYIRALTVKRDNLQAQVDQIEELIEGIRKLCEHDWVCMHNYGGGIFECSICGKREAR